ncbi:MAG: CoA-binding protein [Spirochaetota bacterium]|nr:CoA-binding protein [Spirochaetota bacterium]
MTEQIIEQLDSIFKPRSVAIIGASNNPAKWGGMVLQQAISSKFRGDIYPINPKEKEVFGLKAYPDVLDIPSNIDLAVFTVPAAHMPKIMGNCIKKGVKGGVIITADFAETGERGKALEDETVRIAKSGGLRFIGPNGNGLWTSAVGLNVSPFPQPGHGPMAFISQSGTFRFVAAQVAGIRGFGISKSISIGNQADLQIADFLEYLAQDDDTRVICLYVEGLKDGRRFFNVARRVSRIKPIIIFKGGSSTIGAKATLSHTASIAGSDEIFDAMCQQAGLIRVDEIGHLFIMAEALFSQPLPKGKRVAIIGNGGQGVTMVDKLVSWGVEIPELNESDKQRLKGIMPPHAPIPNNPIDFAAGTMETMDEVRIVEMIASIDYIDGIITNVPFAMSFQPSLAEQKKSVISAIDIFSNLPEKYGKPIITQKWMEQSNVSDILKSKKIPMFDSTEDCSRAMHALVKYAEIKKRIGI